MHTTSNYLFLRLLVEFNSEKNAHAHNFHENYCDIFQFTKVLSAVESFVYFSRGNKYIVFPL